MAKVKSFSRNYKGDWWLRKNKEYDVVGKSRIRKEVYKISIPNPFYKRKHDKKKRKFESSVWKKICPRWRFFKMSHWEVPNPPRGKREVFWLFWTMREITQIVFSTVLFCKAGKWLISIEMLLCHSKMQRMPFECSRIDLSVVP